MHELAANVSRVYSPVALSNEWSQPGRLLFTLACSVIGTIMNSFFVASFFVEISLQRIGMVFMACIGIADLFITFIVMPVSSVVLLSGKWDTDPVCYALQFVTEGATYSYCLAFTTVAFESLFRLSKSNTEYDAFTTLRVGVSSIMIFLISFIVAAVGVYLELDYDYCHRRHIGNFPFKVATGMIFNVIPFSMTLYCLVGAACRIRERARDDSHYRRSQQFEQDATTNNLNITAYFLFVAAWSPYLAVVYVYPDSSDSQYYYSAWLGVCRAVITSFLYGCIDSNFRRAFSHLYNYCFCKNSLTGSFASRHRRALEYKCATGDVRVHIMHQAVNTSSPQRGGSSTRETHEL